MDRETDSRTDEKYVCWCELYGHTNQEVCAIITIIINTERKRWSKDKTGGQEGDGNSAALSGHPACRMVKSLLRVQNVVNQISSEKRSLSAKVHYFGVMDRK